MCVMLSRCRDDQVSVNEPQTDLVNRIFLERFCQDSDLVLDGECCMRGIMVTRTSGPLIGQILTCQPSHWPSHNTSCQSKLSFDQVFLWIWKSKTLLALTSDCFIPCI